MFVHVVVVVCCYCVSVVSTATIRNHDDQPYHDYPPINSKESLGKDGETPQAPPLLPSYHGFPYNYRGFPYNYLGFPYGMSYGYPAGMGGYENQIETFSCPKHGIYYRDDHSFYSCHDKDYRVLYCAPGSKNKPKTFYEATVDYQEEDFCAINLTWQDYDAPV